MPLVDVDILNVSRGLPTDVRAFVREANHRIKRFQFNNHIPAFVPSDFVGAFGVLTALADDFAQPGRLFCEWGSGFGVVACLAAMLDFDAHGIEIEAELVNAAQQLAHDFDLPVSFHQGSFIPPGGEECLASARGFAWLALQSDNLQETLGLMPEDFAVIFAFPWPDEDGATAELFERYAGAGAVLVTYDGVGFRVRRKTG